MVALPQDASVYIEYIIHHRENVLAPWIAGPAVDLYAAGIYTILLVRYWCLEKAYHIDNRRVVVLVSVVAVLSALKTAAALYIMFLMSVELNGDTFGWAIAAFKHWVIITTPLSTTVINLIVQSYYVMLLYKLLCVGNGRRFHVAFRWIILCLIYAAFTASLIFGVLAVHEMLAGSYRHPEIYITVQLGTSFFGDALVSGGIVYCLMNSAVYNPRHHSTINKFARFIALSAAAPALMALLNFILVATNVAYNRWHVVFDFALSKAFSISFMWTIEARRKILASDGRRHPVSVEPRTNSLQEPANNMFGTQSMLARTRQQPQSPECFDLKPQSPDSNQHLFYTAEYMPPSDCSFAK